MLPGHDTVYSEPPKPLYFVDFALPYGLYCLPVFGLLGRLV
jgi:hypothetical protein